MILTIILSLQLQLQNTLALYSVKILEAFLDLQVKLNKTYVAYIITDIFII